MKFLLPQIKVSPGEDIEYCVYTHKNVQRCKAKYVKLPSPFPDLFRLQPVWSLEPSDF